ncbi:RdgB/HAM1 family non-canonical purine NTP pyrophosphatase, partial [Myxococcota bacterium]|nr:RdgB/HAM1 family non-canonical purine NTP pyrophosphatase [Myxococcota bacterium]
VERAKQTGLPTVADDSGLEVDALDGRPGVHSARYGGPGAEDRERVELLLREMEGKHQRSARFVSVIAFCPSPRSSEVITVRGECEGAIAFRPSGDQGFGYDPIFLLPDGQTMAELSMAEKNTVSHRAKAFQKILPYLQNFIDSQ